MNEREFATQAGEIMARIETLLENHDDVDFELAAGGILEIDTSRGERIIINRHTMAREIWVAARSGGFHFRWDGAEWRDTRDGSELLARLLVLLG